MGTKAQTSGNRVAAANILVLVMAGIMLVAGTLLGLPRLKSEMAPAGEARIEKVESGPAAAAKPDSIPDYYASRAIAEAAAREPSVAAANPDSIPAFYTERYYEAAAARNASDAAQSGEAEDYAFYTERYYKAAAAHKTSVAAGGEDTIAAYYARRAAADAAEGRRAAEAFWKAGEPGASGDDSKR